jgi:hypothetical protein
MSVQTLAPIRLRYGVDRGPMGLDRVPRTDPTWRSAAMPRSREPSNHRAQGKSSHFRESAACTTAIRGPRDRRAGIWPRQVARLSRTPAADQHVSGRWDTSQVRSQNPRSRRATGEFRANGAAPEGVHSGTVTTLRMLTLAPCHDCVNGPVSKRRQSLSFSWCSPKPRVHTRLCSTETPECSARTAHAA